MCNYKSIIIAVAALMVISLPAISKENTVKHKNVSPHLLFVGDSHAVGLFGHTLTTLIHEFMPQIALMTVASCGSDPRWWLEEKITHCGLWVHYLNGLEYEKSTAQTPNIRGLLKLVKPKMTIVELGSNIIPMNNEDREHYTNEMMQIIQHKGGGECIWISAPDSRTFSATELNNVYEVLKKLSKKHHCKLVDSRKYTKYPNIGGDGLHYGGLLAITWAEKVFLQALKPILLKTFAKPLQHKTH